MAENHASVAGSFRDPAGFLFVQDGVLYRQVNRSYQHQYELLIGTGLYQSLVDDGLLVPHEETDLDAGVEADRTAGTAVSAYRVIRPEVVDFISYPYEWCFSQLKDAALTTLRIQQRALQHGMNLKDASAYNIQFHRGKPVLIDTLSFEEYREGEPWVAYRQLCQHFLAPLALMQYRDVRLGQLLRVFLDGVPLDLASKLLPLRSCFRFALLTHLHLQGKAEHHLGEGASGRQRTTRVSKNGLLGILDSLTAGITALRWRPQGTEWADYYESTNYSETAWQEKIRLVGRLVAAAQPAMVWDLGANTGVFSEIAAEVAGSTISFDIDPAAVERSYRRCVEQKSATILPLVLDLTNPSPGIGWMNAEREPVWHRGDPDLILALALIHHLAIGNNLPFAKIAESLATICRSLVIEFVPKSDSQVEYMLSTRKDVFPDYHQEGFEQQFSRFFAIRESVKLPDSQRTIYLMDSLGPTGAARP